MHVHLRVCLRFHCIASNTYHKIPQRTIGIHRIQYNIGCHRMHWFLWVANHLPYPTRRQIRRRSWQSRTAFSRVLRDRDVRHVWVWQAKGCMKYSLKCLSGALRFSSCLNPNQMFQTSSASRLPARNRKKCLPIICREWYPILDPSKLGTTDFF
jgi:hypothetical protein